MGKRFRSRFEASTAKANPTAQYETIQLEYVQPAKSRKYTPDFVLPNGIMVETKGYMDLAARQKYIWIKASNPQADIRFVFQTPRKTISKASKTTYGDWATRAGFTWAEKTIPPEWSTE